MGHVESTASLSDFVADPQAHLKRLGGGSVEILLEDGHPRAVMVAPEEWERIRAELDQAAFIASLRRGLADIDAGRTIPLEEIESRFRDKHGF